MANDNNIQPVADDSQIVLYQPDESIRLEVKLEHDTVWLNRQQMAQLFGRDIKTIGKHINNALLEELALDPTGANFATIENRKNPTIAKFAIVQKEGGRLVTRQVEFYSLDVVLSVGYRVKSNRGIQFRRWANVVLRDYLLQGYSVNRHLIALQENMDKRMTHIEDVQAKQQQQLDFFIRTSTPPAEMVFFEGDFYTARVALENLIRTANHRVIRKWRNESHDRWLIINNSLYHCGHSLNANGGHKISAITLMGTSPEVILSEVE